jgi:hypothetical protein
VNISGETVTGSATFEACDKLTIDTSTVTGTGDLTLHARRIIVIENGFVVQPGGTVTGIVVK